MQKNDVFRLIVWVNMKNDDDEGEEKEESVSFPKQTQEKEPLLFIQHT